MQQFQTPWFYKSFVAVLSMLKKISGGYVFDKLEDYKLK